MNTNTSNKTKKINIEKEGQNGTISSIIVGYIVYKIFKNIDQNSGTWDVLDVYDSIKNDFKDSCSCSIY